jgi:hypothetical protein
VPKQEGPANAKPPCFLHYEFLSSCHFPNHLGKHPPETLGRKSSLYETPARNAEQPDESSREEYHAGRLRGTYWRTKYNVRELIISGVLRCERDAREVSPAWTKHELTKRRASAL